MLRQLDRLDAGIRSGRADDDACPLERLDVGGIEPEAAVVVALERLGAADRGEARARHRSHEPHLADQAAGEAADDWVDGIRIALLVGGVRDSGAAPRELDERVLEPAAGAEERYPGREALADRRERGSASRYGVPGSSQTPSASSSDRAVGLSVATQCAPPRREQCQRGVDLAVRQVAGVAIAEGDDHRISGASGTRPVYGACQAGTPGNLFQVVGVVREPGDGPRNSLRGLADARERPES